MAKTQNLGDSAQTTAREASLDPSKDNVNALKNAHLTPTAVRRVSSGKTINPEVKDEQSFTKSTTPKSTPKKQTTDSKTTRSVSKVPRPVKRSTPNTSSEPSTSVSKAPKPIRRSTPTKTTYKARPKATEPLVYQKRFVDLETLMSY